MINKFLNRNWSSIELQSIIMLYITPYVANKSKMHKKGKTCRAPLGHRQGAHPPFLGRWAHRWINHWVCNAWPVRRETYGYLPSRKASPPFRWYQIIPLDEQRHMCMNNLPKIVTWQCSGQESIWGPFGHQSGSLTLHHQDKLNMLQCYKIK